MTVKSEYCCQMRRHIIFGIVATNGRAPGDMADYITSWEPLILEPRYCPWCGSRLDPESPKTLAPPPRNRR